MHTYTKTGWVTIKEMRDGLRNCNIFCRFSEILSDCIQQGNASANSENESCVAGAGIHLSEEDWGDIASVYMQVIYSISL